MIKFCIVLGIIATCSAETIYVNPRIEGGAPAEIEDFPYIASVQIPGPGKVHTHITTGTILNNRWILTTTSFLNHFDYLNAFKVRTSSTHSDKLGINYTVVEKVTHPSYVQYVDGFDLALLKVDRDIEFNEKTKSIELYTEDTVGANLSGSLVGWGNTRVESTKVSRLYSVGLKTVGTIEKFKLFVTFVGDDVCYSDVGGPFVVDGKVFGISTLYRLGCGKPDQYVTRFDASTLEWIRSVIA